MVKIKDVKVNLGFMSVTFVEDELDETLASLVEEMRIITKDLSTGEQDILHKIMGSASPLLVSDVFDGFERKTKEHETLRKLRDAQFVRPKERGTWRANKHIAIKPFGRVMWDKIGPKQLFNNDQQA